jgi:TonB family protein
MGAVFAGLLEAGDSIRVEFELPSTGRLVSVRARVRYHTKLRYGLSFLELSNEQRSLIEDWSRRVDGLLPPARSSVPALEAPSAASPAAQTRRKSRPRLWSPVYGVLILAVGAAWWHWQRGWEELESTLPRAQSSSRALRVQVPPEVMQQLVVHRVEPVYPDRAREAGLQGTVTLNAIIAQDGSVVDLRPVSGPAPLIEAAIAAVRWWRFEPYRVKGQASEVETTIGLEFRAH